MITIDTITKTIDGMKFELDYELDRHDRFTNYSFSVDNKLYSEHSGVDVHTADNAEWLLDYEVENYLSYDHGGE